MNTHPSFGMVGITHVRGHANLFGCSFRHTNYIEFKVRQAERKRDLCGDSIFARKELIGFAVSPAQFTELITSPNVGYGVPCTLTDLNGQRIETCPVQNTEKEKIYSDFAQSLKELDGRLTDAKKQIETILSKPTINKSDRANIINLLGSISQQIELNIPFVQQCFSENVDKMVNEAKVELAATVSTTLRTLGIEKLKELSPKLLE